MRDVVILGGGFAGLSAAVDLRDLDVEILELEPSVGGRARSSYVSDGVWANWGGAYFPPDRVRCAQMVDLSGAAVLPSRTTSSFDIEGFLDMGFELTEADRVAITAVERRLETEQQNVRPATSAELDDVSFAEWLGDLAPAVRRYFDHWGEVYLGGSVDNVSLYAALLAHGPMKTVAFATPSPVPLHDKGNFVVVGGAAAVLRGLVDTLSLRVSCNTQVDWVEQDDDGVTVTCTIDGQPTSVRAKQAICALPAQTAWQVIDMPEVKREALASTEFGRKIVAMLEVLPPKAPPVSFPVTTQRPGQQYECVAFAHRVPDSIDQLLAQGGSVNGSIYDRYAESVWFDRDESILSGVYHRLVARHPELVGRLIPHGVARWRYGVPRITTGRMKQLELLQAPVGRVQFCGDYAHDGSPNFEAAARSGIRAARAVRQRFDGGRAL